jgi:hypothetical protein
MCRNRALLKERCSAPRAGRNLNLFVLIEKIEVCYRSGGGGNGGEVLDELLSIVAIQKVHSIYL